MTNYEKIMSELTVMNLKNSLGEMRNNEYK